ncbi:MAG: deoxynucleoside kinase [Clostridiales bacterium]|nr:deoxynucleoside kinase [Clostridiales bacterium]
MPGKLIVLEGLDGSGKSTQVGMLYERLERNGVDLRLIKLPDYDSDSSALVKMYLSGKFGTAADSVNPYAASAFYAVDRYASYNTDWKSDYESGKIVLADRYVSSNAIYQMTKLPREGWDAYLEWLSDFEYEKMGVPRPQKVIFLDMPVEVSQALMTSRYHGEESMKDVHERNVKFLTECRCAALYAADKLGWEVISCAESGKPYSREAVAEKIDLCLKLI